MKFIFNQTADDILDLSKDSFRSSKMIKYGGLIFLFLVLVNILPILLKGNINTAALISWILPILLIGLFWFVAFKFIMKKRLNDKGTKNVMLGKRKIELLDEGIHVETPVYNTTYKWSAITKLSQSDNSYFLYLGKSQALIIPKRVFKSEEEKALLENFVKERISNN